MEYEKIKQLMEDMENSKLTSIDIDFADGTKISMKKEQKQEIIHTNPTLAPIINEQKVVTMGNTEKQEQTNGNLVKSPIVGTFYIKPSPTSNPYVEIGKEVKKGDTLCIVEAMKLMNEIESEFSGKIIEILVNDGEPVEYGTPLFRIK